MSIRWSLLFGNKTHEEPAIICVLFRWDCAMQPSWHGNAFGDCWPFKRAVTGGFHSQSASNAEQFCVFFRYSNIVAQTNELPVFCDVMTLCNYILSYVAQCKHKCSLHHGNDIIYKINRLNVCCPGLNWNSMHNSYQQISFKFALQSIQNLTSLRCQRFHYTVVIMSAMASQMTCVSIVCSSVGSSADQKGNIKAPRHWTFCGQFTGDRWLPRTKGQ